MHAPCSTNALTLEEGYEKEFAATNASVARAAPTSRKTMRRIVDERATGDGGGLIFDILIIWPRFPSLMPSCPPLQVNLRV